MRLPEELCDWCGGEIRRVRLLANGKPHPHAQSIIISATPVAADDWRGKLVRVPPAHAGGRIDCACPVEFATWRYQRRYLYHKDDCREADKWTTHKKWNAGKYKRRLPPTPELDERLPPEVIEREAEIFATLPD